eukprot:6892534-Prymnesium_polylepis.1
MSTKGAFAFLATRSSTEGPHVLLARVARDQLDEHWVDGSKRELPIFARLDSERVAQAADEIGYT